MLTSEIIFWQALICIGFLALGTFTVPHLPYPWSRAFEWKRFVGTLIILYVIQDILIALVHWARK